MGPEEFEEKAHALLKLSVNPEELSEPLSIRLEQIGVAARAAWIESPSTPPVISLINEALETGDTNCKRHLRLYVLPNLHLIGVATEDQQNTIDRLPQPLRSEWLGTQRDLDAIQKRAE